MSDKPTTKRGEHLATGEKAVDYKQAGVDIKAGQSLVDWLQSERPQKWPHQDRLVSKIGGFSALFRGGFPEMESPCLVSATDGVGTKVLLATHFRRFEEVGQDLVAMCVNDLVCCGAQPLFFLDYYATGKLDLKAAQSFLKGVQRACLESNCALIGGETAEMPGVYREKDFDCAGFAVGVVDEKTTLGPHLVKAGDRLMAFPSSGFHSNGFSLLRQVFATDLSHWQDELMTPTKLYAQPVQQLLLIKGLHALAHITGGGMDNLCRVMPKGTKAQLKKWEIPAPFLEVKRRVQLDLNSLLKTLNCGVGMVAIVGKAHWELLFEKAQNVDLKPFDLGTIESSSQLEPSWSLEGVS